MEWEMGCRLFLWGLIGMSRYVLDIHQTLEASKPRIERFPTPNKSVVFMGVSPDSSPQGGQLAPDTTVCSTDLLSTVSTAISICRIISDTSDALWAAVSGS